MTNVAACCASSLPLVDGDTLVHHCEQHHGRVAIAMRADSLRGRKDARADEWDGLESR